MKHLPHSMNMINKIKQQVWWRTGLFVSEDVHQIIHDSVRHADNAHRPLVDHLYAIATRRPVR